MLARRQSFDRKVLESLTHGQIDDSLGRRSYAAAAFANVADKRQVTPVIVLKDERRHLFQEVQGHIVGEARCS